MRKTDGGKEGRRGGGDGREGGREGGTVGRADGGMHGERAERERGRDSSQARGAPSSL